MHSYAHIYVYFLFYPLVLFLASVCIGAILYEPTCKERVLQIPNSVLAEAIRSGKALTKMTKEDLTLYRARVSNRFDCRQDFHRLDRNDYSVNVMDDTSGNFRPSMDSEYICNSGHFFVSTG